MVFLILSCMSFGEHRFTGLLQMYLGVKLRGHCTLSALVDAAKYRLEIFKGAFSFGRLANLLTGK